MASYGYDFSRFEDKDTRGLRYERDGNAAREVMPIEDPRRRESERPERKNNVIEIPKEELEKSRRVKLSPFKVFTRSFFFLVIFGSVIMLVFNQVQLTELTDQIHTETKALSEAQALEVQLEMKTTEKINSAQIEEYARGQLGMTKISENQVEYMNMATEDKGIVLELSQDGNIFQRAIEKVKSVFA